MTGLRIFGDWGSTNLRLWLMRDGTVIDRAKGPGIVGSERPAAENLRAAIAPWLSQGPERIVLCGMAGARDGLSEAPYADCPADLASWRRAAARLDLDGLPVIIGAGCAARGDQGRPDVMRGEETQVFGALKVKPELARGERLVVHPGTHSKWVTLKDGTITGFRTFLTGEMFALLQRSSLVVPGGDEMDEDGFALGLERAGEGDGLLGQLFEARAGRVRDNRPDGWSRGFLSGLLLGSEAAAMRGHAAAREPVTLIGGAALRERYARALSTFGWTVETLEDEPCTLAGLEMLDDGH